MNKLFTIALSILMIISCSSARYVALDDPQEEIIASTVLAAKHPELVEHYREGVLRITSLREIPLGNGEYDYDIRYQFVKYHYPTLEERLELLSTRYPELYKLYIDGRIELLEVYKYVDDNLNIRTFVSYRRIYDSYYYSYPRYYYRGQRYHSRPLPPPHRPRIEPRPKHGAVPPPPRTNPRVNNRPNIRPNGGRPAKPNNVTPKPQSHPQPSYRQPHSNGG